MAPRRIHRSSRALLLAALVGGCTVYDDIALDVTVPIDVQTDFASTHPDMLARLVVFLDEDPSSLGVLCDLGTTEVTWHANYLQVGCFDVHTFSVFLVPLDPASGVACGPEFELGLGGRDSAGLDPVATLSTTVGKNGRCEEQTELSIVIGATE